MLPKPIAERLKRNPSAIADGFPEVTMLFADVVDFTRMSASMPPERLVAWLNDVFSQLDTVADRFGLEKIKTVGDSFMAASGLPTPRPDRAEAAAEMALRSGGCWPAARRPKAGRSPCASEFTPTRWWPG
ncbi:MAG: adenylate/guanylate cyclase domain-containing protein [Armatimonadota bacterium]|nr:adenylate/guanylate cyclase domain-containing protein [Armatimonadota bacterium]